MTVTKWLWPNGCDQITVTNWLWPVGVWPDVRTLLSTGQNKARVLPCKYDGLSLKSHNYKMYKAYLYYALLWGWSISSGVGKKLFWRGPISSFSLFNTLWRSTCSFSLFNTLWRSTCSFSLFNTLWRSTGLKCLSIYYQLTSQICI